MVKTAKPKSTPNRRTATPKTARSGRAQLDLPFCPAGENWFLHRRTVVLPLLNSGKKFTQYDIGYRTRNYTGSAVGNWERYINAPPAKDAARLAAAYEVSVEEMVKRINELALEIVNRQPATNEGGNDDSAE